VRVLFDLLQLQQFAGGLGVEVAVIGIEIGEAALVQQETMTDFAAVNVVGNQAGFQIGQKFALKFVQLLNVAKDTFDSAF
jgi:hypothetical protein